MMLLNFKKHWSTSLNISLIKMFFSIRLHTSLPFKMFNQVKLMFIPFLDYNLIDSCNYLNFLWKACSIKSIFLFKTFDKQLNQFKMIFEISLFYFTYTLYMQFFLKKKLSNFNFDHYAFFQNPNYILFIYFIWKFQLKTERQSLNLKKNSKTSLKCLEQLIYQIQLGHYKPNFIIKITFQKQSGLLKTLKVFSIKDILINLALTFFEFNAIVKPTSAVFSIGWELWPKQSLWFLNLKFKNHLNSIYFYQQLKMLCFFWEQRLSYKWFSFFFFKVLEIFFKRLSNNLFFFKTVEHTIYYHYKTIYLYLFYKSLYQFWIFFISRTICGSIQLRFILWIAILKITHIFKAIVNSLSNNRLYNFGQNLDFGVNQNTFRNKYKKLNFFTLFFITKYFLSSFFKFIFNDKLFSLLFNLYPNNYVNVNLDWVHSFEYIYNISLSLKIIFLNKTCKGKNWSLEYNKYKVYRYIPMILVYLLLIKIGFFTLNQNINFLVLTGLCLFKWLKIPYTNLLINLYAIYRLLLNSFLSITPFSTLKILFSLLERSFFLTIFNKNAKYHFRFIYLLSNTLTFRFKFNIPINFFYKFINLRGIGLIRAFDSNLVYSCLNNIIFN